MFPSDILQRLLTNQGETCNELVNLTKKEECHSGCGFWTTQRNTPQNTAWIKKVDKNKKEEEMKELVITAELVKKRSRKIKNWSVPSEDELDVF